jgi:hypothetical protein
MATRGIKVSQPVDSAKSDEFYKTLDHPQPEQRKEKSHTTDVKSKGIITRTANEMIQTRQGMTIILPFSTHP